eukprot:scaffold11281_cov74-Skeletonema_dohrnii-CCMP3373.AAC.2
MPVSNSAPFTPLAHKNQKWHHCKGTASLYQEVTMLCSSPTWTALYNWLVAKKGQLDFVEGDGGFVLRVEDTDLARSTKGENVLEFVSFNISSSMQTI